MSAVHSDPAPKMVRSQLATSAEQVHANVLFKELRGRKGARLALAVILDRAPKTITGWHHIPSAYVRPFLRAHESGALERAIQNIAPVIAPAERERARDITRKVRAQAGGGKALASALNVAESSVKTWDDVPERHIPALLKQFGSVQTQAERSIERPPVKVSASTARVSGVWHRNCLFCGAAFSIDSPFIRRCEAHRGQG
ncbi:hypothetical protein HW511_00335 [Asaia siamensis]|uniref:ROS/MUCR transcriptional regulator protein n=1 Tax=Asaia siamensis TaxID=110479 RepID=A0ABQ1M8A1_9PROT|nr:hypothetical protein [Asaia siamensis]GBR06360.1 hypothetical protein AA0323_1366 [Asaia siamensis NRIC 0323]GGC34341.1 hypothetical protein GCM10007207_19850 [Asaia siamensis]